MAGIIIQNIVSSGLASFFSTVFMPGRSIRSWACQNGTFIHLNESSCMPLEFPEAIEQGDLNDGHGLDCRLGAALGAERVLRLGIDLGGHRGQPELAGHVGESRPALPFARAAVSPYARA